MKEVCGGEAGHSGDVQAGNRCTVKGEDRFLSWKWPGHRFLTESGSEDPVEGVEEDAVGTPEF